MVRYLKKIIFLIVISLLVISISAAEIDVSRTASESIQVNEPYTATLKTGTVTYSQFDIAELLPVGWELVDWSVSGNASAVNFEHSTTSYIGSVREVYKWSFSEAAANGIELGYTAIPRRAGSFNITTMLTYSSPAGFSSAENKIFVGGTTPGMMCGNNICESLYGENVFTCPQDCRFNMLTNPMVMLSVLILAMAIIFAGLAYREYKMYGPEWAKPKLSVLDRPVEEVVFQEEKQVKVVAQKKARAAPKKARVATVRPVFPHRPKAKRIAKRVAKRGKAAAKHTKFYKNTMERLERIRKNLK
jgi:hypothetical protein